MTSGEIEKLIGKIRRKINNINHLSEEIKNDLAILDTITFQSREIKKEPRYEENKYSPF